MEIIDNTNESIIYPSAQNTEGSHFSSFMEYQRLYDKSIEDPQQFWSDVAKQLSWKCPPKTVLDYNFDVRNGPISIRFMSGTLTNVCYNVLDRIVERGLGDRIAYHWSVDPHFKKGFNFISNNREGNDGKTKRRITYSELRREVCKFANGLKGLGVKKGDRIAIYMPVSIECVVAMLACARIGAVHSVIFAGFSPESLALRIIDARCILLISSDGCYRANKLIPLKNMTDSALDICRERKYQKISNIVSKHLNSNSEGMEVNNNELFSWNEQVDICWQTLTKNQSDICEPVWVDAEHPLFTLYTSGSTGEPKGIVHTCGGYLTSSYVAFKFIFDKRDDTVFFSTSDLGWGVAHHYTVYGGLANGATMILMEGTPTFPTSERIWEIIDRLEVNVFNTAPTVLRILMKSGDHCVKSYKRDSLRVLSVTGEPINSEAWLWYWNVVGDRRCSVVNMYGQTETVCQSFKCVIFRHHHQMYTITNLPGCTPMKPGSATLPFFGVVSALLNDNGEEINGPGQGHLVYKTAWPGFAPTIDGKHDFYESTYFKKFAGYYWTGDEAKRDSDGYYWIMGRIDDKLNVCGHLLSTTEIETAINEHRAVAEAAAVSAPHSVKGEVPIVFVVLNNGYVMTPELELEMKNRARENIGGHALPHMIVEVSALPKTRTGKIMRRILNKLIRNDSNFGDTSTLEDESVLNELKLIQNKIDFN